MNIEIRYIDQYSDEGFVVEYAVIDDSGKWVAGGRLCFDHGVDERKFAESLLAEREITGNVIGFNKAVREQTIRQRRDYLARQAWTRTDLTERQRFDLACDALEGKLDKEI